MKITTIDRVHAFITIKWTNADGTVATPSAVDVSLLPMRTFPTTNTVWTPPTSLVNGVAEAIIAGTYANQSGALVVPLAGADLWVRVQVGDQIVTAMSDRITIET